MLCYLSPWYWVTSTCRNIKAVIVDAWKKPSWWNTAKAAFLVWFLIPTSVPVTAYKLAELLGYETEARELTVIFLGMFGELGWLCLDALAKALLVAAAFLLHL